ncbi:MAG: hypothetical protein N2234_06885 [Planctomycetota bacterium]|nr:hypothetical protein [Planctomycetota bacterium]
MKFVCGGCGNEWESEKKEGRCEICGARVVAQGVSPADLQRRVSIIVIFGTLMVVFIAAVGLYILLKFPSEESKEEMAALLALDELSVAMSQYWMENEETYPRTLSVLSAQGALPEGANLETENSIKVGNYRIFYFVKKDEGDETEVKFVSYILYAQPLVSGLRHFMEWAKRSYGTVTVGAQVAAPRVHYRGTKFLVAGSSVKVPSNFEEANRLLEEAKPWSGTAPKKPQDSSEK